MMYLPDMNFHDIDITPIIIITLITVPDKKTTYELCSSRRKFNAYILDALNYPVSLSIQAGIKKTPDIFLFFQI